MAVDRLKRRPTIAERFAPMLNVPAAVVLDQQLKAKRHRCLVLQLARTRHKLGDVGCRRTRHAHEVESSEGYPSELTQLPSAPARALNAQLELRRTRACALHFLHGMRELFPASDRVVRVDHFELAERKARQHHWQVVDVAAPDFQPKISRHRESSVGLLKDPRAPHELSPVVLRHAVDIPQAKLSQRHSPECCQLAFQ